MKNLRKTIGLLMVLAAAAFGLSSHAAFGADKAFTLNMLALAPALSPATVTATFTNQGNSSFNSLTLDAPSGLEIIGTPTANRGTATLVSTGSGNRVKVLNINLPTGSGQFVTLTLTARRTSATCGATSGNWIGQPWTGSGLTGNTFGLVSPSTISTTISVACMSFSNQPANAFTNTVITSTNYNPAGNPVQVSLNPPPAPGITVSLASSCSGVTLSGASATSDVNGLATFSSLKSSSTNGTSCALIASASPFQGATSSGFKVGTPSLTFGTNNQPNTTLSGAVITSTPFNNPSGNFVTVNLLLDGQPTSAFDTTSVQIAGSPGSCIGSGNTTMPISGVATFSHLTAGVVGSCVLTATVPAYPPFGSTPPSTSFTVAPSSGTLVCQGQEGSTGLPSTFHSTDQAVQGNRGPINKDGTPCSPVVYAINSSVGVGTNLVSMKWDTATQPNAEFGYTIMWAPVPVDANGWTAKRPNVSWLNDPSTFAPIFVPGLACLSNKLPAPYGTVTADSGGATISVDTSSPVGGIGTTPAPAVDFPILVGTERMLVTGVSGGTWTVLRAQGGTTTSTHIGAAVMSTPLPIIPNDTVSFPAPYVVGTQAHMCIVDHMWVSGGLDSAGNLLIRYSTQAFDIGDGAMDLSD